LRTGIFKKRPRSVKFAQSKKNRTDLRKINAQAKVKLPLEQIKIVFARGSAEWHIFSVISTRQGALSHPCLA